MYHAILAMGQDMSVIPGQDRMYAVHWTDWQAQLNAVRAASDFSPVLPLQDRKSVGGRKSGHGICLTFDDAWKQHLHVAAPELLERGLPGLFFITTGQVAQTGMLLWNEVRELADLGFTIGSHGRTHRFLTDLKTADLRDELHHARKELEDEISHPVNLLSLPGGRCNERVLETARDAGFIRIFTSDPGLWQHGEIVPRVAVRTGEAGTETVKALLADPFIATGRLARRAKTLNLAKRILGNRLYHWLHGLSGGR